jgi:hypothetical protein
MADIITNLVHVPADIKSTWKDMGDGTHALVIYIGNEGDDISGAQVVMTSPHHEVHEGETYQASYKSPDASAVADDGTVDILLRNGADVGAHLVWHCAAGGDAEVAFYEGTTTSDVGTNLAESNVNRTSRNEATLQVTHTPTVSAVGELLSNYLIPGGSGAIAGGGAIRSSTEWILEKGKTYLLRATNRAGTAQPMSVVVQWYEEEG